METELTQMSSSSATAHQGGTHVGSTTSMTLMIPDQPSPTELKGMENSMGPQTPEELQFEDSLLGINPNARVPISMNWRRIMWVPWLCIIGVMFILWLLISQDILGYPRDRGFFKDDQSIAWPKQKSTIPAVVVFLVYALFPALCILGYNFFLAWKMRDDRINVTIAQLFWLATAHFLNELATNSLKFLVGRHRPDYLARCVPNYSATNADVDPNTGYVANPSVVCTTTDVEYLADGRKSFPSGHASISMTGAVFFGIYIYRCFRKSPSMGSIVPLILAYIFILSAVIVGASRISDNKHNTSDVIVGLIMGAFFGSLPYVVAPRHFAPELFPTSYNLTSSQKHN